MSRLDTLLKDEKDTSCFNAVYKKQLFVSAKQCMRRASCVGCPALLNEFVMETLMKLLEE